MGIQPDPVRGPGAATERMSMERLDFVNRANADYIERLYEQYQRDPRSLDEFWQAYFAGFETAGGRGFHPPTGAEGEKPRALTLGVHNLVHSYRELGHFVARLDPLGHDRPSHPLLQLSEFGLSPGDLDKPSIKGGFHGPPGTPDQIT